MALSDDEQRRLDELAADLFAEDPNLVNTLRGTTTKVVHKKRAAFAGLGFAAGILLLIVGMEFGWPIIVVGFIVMLVSVLAGLKAWEVVDVDTKATRQSPISKPTTSLFDLMEDRWNQRQQGDKF